MGNINTLQNNTHEKCKICEKVKKNDIIDYTFIDIDILCKTCKQKKIDYCLLYEKYRFESCHGGC